MFIQSALLYTTSGGQRRIRVHTLRIPLVQDSPRQVLENINISSYVNLFCREGNI